MVSVHTLLQESSLPVLEAELLLAHALDKNREWLIAHGADEIPDDVVSLFQSLQARRLNHEPIAYIVNQKEFYGRNFFVDQRVLIPRPATETLIDMTLEYLKKPFSDVREADTEVVITSKQLRSTTPELIVDVGTGSGCIAVTLALETDLPVIATDASTDALDVAQINTDKYQCGDSVTRQQADLLDGVTIDRPFLLVSNPPYIPITEELMIDVSDYEPSQALFSGADGADHIQQLLQQAVSHPTCVGCIIECKSSHAELIDSLV